MRESGNGKFLNGPTETIQKKKARSEPMAQQTLDQVMPSWTTRRDEKRRRMQLVQPWMKGPVLPTARVVL
jgi:hypothetical protein